MAECEENAKEHQCLCKEKHLFQLHEKTCFRLEEKAPDFCSPAYYRGKEIEICLKDFRGCWLLLFFYSSDFTFV
ncbi:hypothetical protein SPSIL_029620 [Sporomusa silvacetica DSM 10669]|uniref:Alkyl hydroperoxide reductase subunit C/ Thiol specific antioxidant domain-containing protein n=3 Tax=Sporomusa silvacetica TaxID=55504 RepID=A0ABZ3IMB1_9FIRM|nr:hypothetical protein SPSIL_48180 [Sporomusa silvacetica DSM 10669]